LQENVEFHLNSFGRTGCVRNASQPVASTK